MNAVGGAIPAVTAAVAALAAVVEGQLSEALYDIDQTGSKALQQLATDAKAGTSELQRLIRAGEGTANQYEKLLQKGKARQGQYSALSREGRQSANTIATATKLLNEELDRQNTLIKLATTRLREFGGQAQVLRNVRQSAFSRAESGFAAFSQSASRVDNQNAIDRSISRNRAKQIRESAGAIDELQAALQRMEQRKVNWGDALGLDQISTAEGRANRLTQAWNANAKAVTKASSATRELFKGAAGNALIGGAFPLLFGQGPAAAIGGGLGGLAGGLLGGQFGFALSLVGTALGDAVTRSEEFNRSVAQLNGALSNSSSILRITTGDVEELAKQLSISNDEAVELFSTFSAFDDPATVKELARAFGDVGGVATAEAIASITDEKSAVEAIDRLRGQIGNKLANQLLKQVELEGSQAASAALLDAVLQKQEKITDETQRTVTLWDRILSAFALSSGGVGIDPNALTPEAIAGERADAIPEANKGVIDQALSNLDRFYKERDRLIKKYTPEREKSNKSALAKQERDARTLRQLEAQFASSTKLLGIERQLAAAQVEGNEAKVRELEIDKLVEQSAGRVAEIKARGLGQAEERLRIQLEENRLEKGLLNLDTKRALERKKLQESFQATIDGLTIELDLAKAVTREEENRLKIQQKRLALEGKGFDDDQVNQIINLEQQLQAAQAPIQSYITQTQKWLNDTEGMIVSLAQSVESSISGAMAGAVDALVTGSKTVQEVLSDMFAEIGRAFVNMAAEIIAKQLVMIALQGILKALGGASGGGGTETNAQFMERTGNLDLVGDSYKNLPKFAEGGYVTGPTNAIVGEGGQSEYIIPASKMNGAMTRWNAGKRGSSVIPSEGGESGGGGSGVNLNMNFQTTKFMDREWVDREQLEASMAAAAAQGGQLGEARALRKLQMSASTRRRVGI
jgi:hypothetical protein